MSLESQMCPERRSVSQRINSYVLEAYRYISVEQTGMSQEVDMHVLREAYISTRREGEFLKRCQVPQGINRCLFEEQSYALDIFDDLAGLSQGELEVKFPWGELGLTIQGTYRSVHIQKCGSLGMSLRSGKGSISMAQEANRSIQRRTSGCYGDDRSLITGFSFELLPGHVHLLVVSFSGHQGAVCGQAAGHTHPGSRTM